MFAQRKRWTPELDAQIRKMRLERFTWDQIAQDMGMGRNTVLERGRKIGAPKGRPPPPPSEDDRRAAMDRPPRPAGHPDSWDLINRGTSLEGEDYQVPNHHFAPVQACCWPIGEPRTASFRFCGAEPAEDKPYCTACEALARPRARPAPADVHPAELDAAA